MKLRVLVFSLCCIIVLSASSSARAEEKSEPKSWQMLADKTSASHDNKYIEAFGNVVLDRGADYIRADYARYYHVTKWVYLKGNIEAKFQGDFLKAEEAEFDLNTHNGWLKNGQVFMDDPHMYFEGALLKKTGPETYEFREATVTACDGDRPAWSIKSSRGDITVDGYAHLWTPRFQILDQPVFASPYAVIPVKTKRQSGFLLPEIGTSDKLGFTYDQPYYQVIDEEQDVTLFSHLMSAKGLMLGAEYRIVPDIHTKGIWKIDFLQDQETEGESLYDDNPNMQRINHDRWWARGKYDGYLGRPDWNLKADLDLVSDQDYLREFSRGYSGFNKTRRDFLQYFGRDIEDNDSNLRINRLLLSKNWAHVGLQSLVEYTQNLEYGSNSKLDNHDSDRDPTLQRLPEIDINLYQTSIFNTPLTIQGMSQAASFWRQYGTTGSRLDLHPLVGYPLHFGYGSIIPKIGVRSTSYFVDNFEYEDKNDNTEDNVQTRILPNFLTTSYTEFSRVFDLAAESEISSSESSSKWLKLKHAIQPRLDYAYIPFNDQDEYPYFDETDRINAANELTYSITNVFTCKSAFFQPNQDVKGTSKLAYDYFELARLRFLQAYDFREATRNEDLDDYPSRPFSDVLTDISFRLTPWLYFTNKTWISPYESGITEHEHSITAHHDQLAYARFSLDYIKELDRYTLQQFDEYLRQGESEFVRQDEQRIASFGAAFSINEAWSTAFLYRVDWENDIDLEKKISLRYDHQCFWTEASWSKEEDDNRFEFRFNLAQLGALGR